MKKIVMLVDDEEDIRESVRAIVEAEGHDVIEAVNAADCLVKLKKTKPDFIFLDIMMPGLPVKELIKKIATNKELKNIKISYLTVVTAADFDWDTMVNGAKVVDYIPKPFHKSDIVKSLKTIFPDKEVRNPYVEFALE